MTLEITMEQALLRMICLWLLVTDENRGSLVRLEPAPQ
jgi:hypothetical protein